MLRIFLLLFIPSFSPTVAQEKILIDVSTASAYAKGHIGNAAKISYFGSDFSAKTEPLTKDK